MTMADAISHNANHLDDFIGYSKAEEPLVVQLGGNDPKSLAKAAGLCESYGSFSEINLNCGCPSSKAKRVGFGAELMLVPAAVTQILSTMSRRATRTDLSVKCRIGVTGRETWPELVEFVQAVSRGGARHLVVHARCCALHGLSPAQNRTVPPLNYEWVYRLAELFPEMRVTLNGGVTSLEEVRAHLGKDCGLAGVMVGREAYNNPFLFAHADTLFPAPGGWTCAVQDDRPSLTRRSVLTRYLEYAEEARENDYYGSSVCRLVKPLHNLFARQACSTAYKRALDTLLKKLAPGRDPAAVTGGEGEEPLLSRIVWQAVRAAVPDDMLDSDTRREQLPAL